MVQKLLFDARESYSSAMNMAFLVLKGECRLAMGELMQSYAILKKWEQNLKQKECIAEQDDLKFTYKEMRKVVENYILWYEETLFVRNKEIILSWLFSWKNEDIPKNDKDAIITFIKIAEIKNFGLPTNWRDFAPKIQ
ncbi:MAG: hypothetical protein E7012_03610 [Alphaproteobacteria bacterium]|nr:hypothetical protein [Alphaproteobacteria bacterium]